MRNSSHAEDVMQEILLRALNRRHQLRAAEKFGSWIWSIASNEIHQFFRRDRGMVSLDEFPNLDARDTAASPLTRFEETERRNWVHACIATLPQRDQAVIRLRDIYGHSVRETAGTLGITQAATKSVHFRARKRLAYVLRARRSGRISGCSKEKVNKEN
jgi:RNA polymerase sigma-70 factor (ECF subfamily)